MTRAPPSRSCSIHDQRGVRARVLSGHVPGRQRLQQPRHRMGVSDGPRRVHQDEEGPNESNRHLVLELGKWRDAIGDQRLRNGGMNCPFSGSTTTAFYCTSACVIGGTPCPGGPSVTPSCPQRSRSWARQPWWHSGAARADEAEPGSSRAMLRDLHRRRRRSPSRDPRCGDHGRRRGRFRCWRCRFGRRKRGLRGMSRGLEPPAHLDLHRAERPDERDRRRPRLPTLEARCFSPIPSRWLRRPRSRYRSIRRAAAEPIARSRRKSPGF